MQASIAGSYRAPCVERQPEKCRELNELSGAETRVAFSQRNRLRDKWRTMRQADDRLREGF